MRVPLRVDRARGRTAFFIEKQTRTRTTPKSRKRTLKSCVGSLSITKKQANRLGLAPYQRRSPLLERCCLILSANSSYQRAENDLKILTGISISHSSLQRKVQRHSVDFPDVKQKLTEVSLDGGKVRIRREKGGKCYWKEYKTARLQGIYYGAFFQDNLSLINWVNSQPLANPLYCLGDGHDGIWNLFAEIGEEGQRQEILDWYHLKENIYKIEADSELLKKLETLLWKGLVEETLNLLDEVKPSVAEKFVKHLTKHRQRLTNYQQVQLQQISSIGSGAVESAVKQISQRLQLTGAQWKWDSVPQILRLRCAYLNGQLAI